ncbi:MAG: tRNA (adenosine(37)-N6)-threonylcarbamoyltransferase complex ATPase subunit type 1 TsaE [Myxococcales bacterium]|nr:tRNA (adenosine(37)-N6)-threonylcarbamoyltransferase complex ATPase subunit type 1 TsaE [Myxococcales bacterium]
MKPVAQHAWRSLTLAQVQEIARVSAQALAGSPAVHHMGITVGLTGELGTGKTAFAQSFIKSLADGESQRVISPTYAILHIYPTQPEVRHGDWYRLSSVDELEAIGCAEYLEAPGINLVEWIRQVPEALPAEWIEVVLTGERELRDLSIRVFGERWFKLVNESFWVVCTEALASAVVDD